MLIRLLTLHLLLFIVFSLSAQDDCACCSEFHLQFDFWVGDWVVLDTAGNSAGENSISKIEGGCVISENWKGATGGTGTSMNYYDRQDSTWNQLWVDSNGGVLKLKGQFDQGKMILKSDLLKGQKVEYYYNQIVWEKNEDGTVSQLWEVYDDKNQLLKTLFMGIYHRKTK